MATTFSLGLANGGANSFRIPFSDNGSKITLTASGTAQLTAPGSDVDTAVIYYTPGAQVWVGANTAPVAATGTWAPCKDDISPSIKDIKPGDVLHFLAIDASDIKVAFYKMDA